MDDFWLDVFYAFAGPAMLVALAMRAIVLLCAGARRLGEWLMIW